MRALYRRALCGGLGLWLGACGTDDSVSTRGAVSGLHPDAGADQTVLVGEEVTLDGSGSVSSGDGMRLKWESLSSRIQLDDETAPVAHFVADVAGVYPFLLWLTSAGHEGTWVSSRVVVTVAASRVPPGDLGTMVRVPGGITVVGIDPGSVVDVRLAAEAPGLVVSLVAFQIDKYEVTNAEYREFTAATSRAYDFGELADFSGDLQPVVGVDWEDARSYCDWRGKRLPTEFEWERAARGFDGAVATSRFRRITRRYQAAFDQAGDRNALKESGAGDRFVDETLAMLDELVVQAGAEALYPWGGAAPDASQANFGGDIAGNVGRTVDVGSYPLGVSPAGAYDMAGNVWEWTDGWLEQAPGRSYYEALTKEMRTNLKKLVSKVEKGKRSNSFPAFTLADVVITDPSGPAPKDEAQGARVIRGGSWIDGPLGVRSAARGAAAPVTRTSHIGFRCAK